MKIKITSLTILLIASVFAIMEAKVKKGESNLKKDVTVTRDLTSTNDFTGDRDRGFGSDVNVVIRKKPSVFVDNKFGFPFYDQPDTHNDFMNSNTSNAPNVGGLGRTAELVNPTIMFHNTYPYSIVKTTPAHLGYHHTKTTVTSFNKRTGKTESHDVINKTPIYGEIESVHNIMGHSIQPLDLQFRRFRKQRNILQENPEFKHSKDLRYVNEGLSDHPRA